MSSSPRFPLCELPRVVLANALEFADMRALLALECTSTSLQQLIHDFHLWRMLLYHTRILAPRNGYSARRRIDDNSAARWKQIVQLAALPARSGASLLHAVRACSSVDNPGEGPANTLVRSSCETDVELLSHSVLAAEPLMLLEWARRIQLKCGCARGRPCYWSTAASWKHTEQDVLEYAMQRDCVVTSVGVTPYRVFWYPGHPTYAPLQVAFSFHELLDTRSETSDDESDADDESPTIVGPAIYTSSLVDIESDMKYQEFLLPRKVFLRRGVLRLHLYGRQQDLGEAMTAWNTENDMAPYYICLSYVGAVGRVLETA